MENVIDPSTLIYDKSEYILCQECLKSGNKKKCLVRQINHVHCKMHGISIQEYKDRYPNEPIMSDNFLAKKATIGTTTYNRKPMTPEEAKAASPNCIEYYIKRNDDNQPIEVLQEKLKEFQKSTNSKEAMLLRGQDLEAGSPMNIKFYNLRYPELTQEEREKMLYDHKTYSNLKRSQVPNNTCVEYFIAQGMTKDEAKEALRKRQSVTSLDYFTERYGETEGKQRYESRLTKYAHTIKNNPDYNSGRSAIANKLFDTIAEKYPNDYQYDNSESGEMIFGYNRIDFVLESKKKIIEFNGEYFHGLPTKYKASDIFTWKKIPYSQIWERDIKKYQSLIDAGYEVLVIWENEFNHYTKDTTAVLDKCVSFLKGETISNPFDKYPQKFLETVLEKVQS